MAHSRKYQHPQYNSVSRELPITDFANPYLTEAMTTQYQNPYSQYPASSIAPAMSYSSSTDSNGSTRTASSMSSASSMQPAYYTHPTTPSFTDPNYQQRQSPPSYTGQDYIMVTEQSATTPSKSSKGTAVERSGSRYVCMYPRCESSFSRSADLSRHYPTVHFPESVRLDCPKPKCSRKGDQGFTRQDHLNEHLRQYHKEPVAKRRSSKSSQRPDTYR
ncbi:hypothetical protein AJ79_09343 [Helicocarpus griseus UAMH5409]|uniref:C2H2-type domain-containing protein n=1 Tax=Helicocarpus griseus UAMH5409 TaxID=1447875 RepID=A0A2B7WKL0_9EURO|nr:hypothetical protein AJ79_09343 [Helicocarpus griseus UAMH5409]